MCQGFNNKLQLNRQRAPTYQSSVACRVGALNKDSQLAFLVHVDETESKTTLGVLEENR